MRSQWRVTICLICSLVILPCLSSAAVVWQDIAAELMSPACPGRTLINCTSGQAEQWRELIKQKLEQGETKGQILQYFVTMRGEEILAAPPKRGFALTAWLFPLFIILNGAGLIIVLAMRWARRSRTEQSTSATPSETPSDYYHDRLQKELKDFTA